MKIITIKVALNGVVGLATDYKSAVAFLIKERWLTIFDDVENEEGYFESIGENLGLDWEETLLSWDIQKFNEYFGGSYTLEEMEVFEAK